MPSSPPSSTQLQAHRFALRRLESALVARDPTLRRDPGRRQQRALLAGAIVGVLALVGFAVVGLVRGDADWRDAAIVRGTPSGSLYAVAHDPDRLVPALNLASARLLAAVVTPRTDPGRGAPPVVVVRDDALAAAPRTAPAGIVGAPSVMPDPAATPAGGWAVCDVAFLDPALPDPVAAPRLTTVVLGGVESTGRQLPDDDALLLRGPDGAFWFVDGGRRARIEVRDGAVQRGLGIEPLASSRPASPALVAALPEGPPLVAPVVAGNGSVPLDPATAALGVPVGGVVDGGGRFFLVGQGGVQEVPAVVAQIVRFANPDRGADPRIAAVPTDRMDVLPRAALVDLGAYPSSFPRVVGYDGAGTTAPPGGGTVTCVRPAAAPGAPAAVTVSSGVPPTTPLPDGPSGVTGAHVEGAGAYVAPAGTPRSGGLLVDPGGRAYPVPDVQAAAALGLGTPTPVAVSVLDLLPRGPTLDPVAALLVR